MRIAAGETIVPAFADSIWILDGARKFQQTSGSSSICEKLSAVFLCGDGKADGILSHGNRRVTNQSIKAEAWYMKYIGWPERHRSSFHGLCIRLLHLILIVEVSVLITIHGHAVRHQRIEPDDLTFTVANNLRIGIAIQ